LAGASSYTFATTEGDAPLKVRRSASSFPVLTAAQEIERLFGRLGSPLLTDGATRQSLILATALIELTGRVIPHVENSDRSPVARQVRKLTAAYMLAAEDGPEPEVPCFCHRLLNRHANGPVPEEVWGNGAI
jgi:hypothetical protein